MGLIYDQASRDYDHGFVFGGRHYGGRANRTQFARPRNTGFASESTRYDTGRSRVCYHASRYDAGNAGE